jgi:hypothetical protein
MSIMETSAFNNLFVDVDASGAWRRLQRMIWILFCSRRTIIDSEKQITK